MNIRDPLFDAILNNLLDLKEQQGYIGFHTDVEEMIKNVKRMKDRCNLLYPVKNKRR